MTQLKRSIEYSNLRKDIEEVINNLRLEDKCNTPDFILAEYLVDCLETFDKAINKREKWYGRFSNTQL